MIVIRAVYRHYCYCGCKQVLINYLWIVFKHIQKIPIFSYLKYENGNENTDCTQYVHTKQNKLNVPFNEVCTKSFKNLVFVCLRNVQFYLRIIIICTRKRCYLPQSTFKAGVGCKQHARKEAPQNYLQ